MNIARDWKHYLQEARGKTVESILEFGNRMHQYKQTCEKKQGGSTFSKDVQEWLGMSQQSADQWVQIGRSEKLTSITGKLPTGQHAIYLLTTLPDEVFEEALEKDMIQPQMTRADVKALKKPEPKPLGWIQLAKSEWKDEAHHGVQWFTDNVKPWIVAEYGEWDKTRFKPEEQTAFLSACQIAHGKYREQHGEAEEQEEVTPLEERIRAEMLSMSAKQRLESAIKTSTKRIEKTFEYRVQEEAVNRLNELFGLKIKWLDTVISEMKYHKAVFTEKEYKKILSAVHTDRYQNLDDVQAARLHEVFDLLKGKEKALKGATEKELAEAKKLREDMQRRMEEAIKKRMNR